MVDLLRFCILAGTATLTAEGVLTTKEPDLTEDGDEAAALLEKLFIFRFPPFFFFFEASLAFLLRSSSAFNFFSLIRLYIRQVKARSRASYAPISFFINLKEFRVKSIEMSPLMWMKCLATKCPLI